MACYLLTSFFFSAICRTDCGPDGMCMRPNLCLCKGNKSLGIPTKLAPSCQFTQQQNPQEDAAGVNSEVAAQLSQPQSK